MGKIFAALCHGTGAWHSVSFINDDLAWYIGKLLTPSLLLTPV